jgi:hypothetical protein
MMPCRNISWGSSSASATTERLRGFPVKISNHFQAHKWITWWLTYQLNFYSNTLKCITGNWDFLLRAPQGTATTPSKWINNRGTWRQASTSIYLWDARRPVVDTSTTAWQCLRHWKWNVAQTLSLTIHRDGMFSGTSMDPHQEVSTSRDCES